MIPLYELEEGYYWVIQKNLKAESRTCVPVGVLKKNMSNEFLLFMLGSTIPMSPVSFLFVKKLQTPSDLEIKEALGGN